MHTDEKLYIILIYVISTLNKYFGPSLESELRGGGGGVTKFTILVHPTYVLYQQNSRSLSNDKENNHYNNICPTMEPNQIPLNHKIYNFGESLSVPSKCLFRINI